MKPIGIFGTSGFAREVNDVAHEMGFQGIFIAKDQAELEAWKMPEEIRLEGDIAKYKDIPFAIGIGENAVREKVWNRYCNILKFTNLIHPTASFGNGQRTLIDEKTGVTVCAGARLTNNIQVGNFCIFNLNITIGHDAIIEDFVNLSPGANISGNVHIGARCWIGTGAAVNQGNASKMLLIGADTVIGSGSVVVRDCDPGSVYVGIPAKKIK